MTERAMICRESRGGEMGGATFWFVRLPDGYLVGCGHDCESESRAGKLAELVNAGEWKGVPS